MSSTAIDMNGWHTASAITYADVNKAIQAQGTGPKSFSQSASDDSASAQGNFGMWSLTTGGSGPLIMMALPITGGQVTIGTAQHPITACTATVKIRANFLPHTGSSLVDLKNDTETPVTVEECQPPQSSFLADAALKQLLQDWLNANLRQFNAVFASVDLDAQYDNEGVSWLKPSYKGYAVAEPENGATLDNSVFAVLCLIDGEQPSGLVYQVDPYAIPGGSNAAFLISPEKFLSHMMLAAVPAMFVGIENDPPTDHFVIDNDGTRIRNRGSLQLQPVELDNGHTVQPTVDDANFTIQLDTGELEIAITDMQFTYSPGIYVHLNYTGRSSLSLDTEHTILDLSVTTQRGSGSVEVSKGIEIAEIILGVASIVAALVSGLGGFIGRTASAAVESATAGTLGAAESGAEDAEQAAQATVTALRGLINGSAVEVSQLAARCFAVAKVAAVAAFCTTLMPAITEIMKAVAEGDYQAMPKITDLTDGAIGKTVIWPSAVGNFRLASAQLNNALQFGLVRD